MPIRSWLLGLAMLAGSGLAGCASDEPMEGAGDDAADTTLERVAAGPRGEGLVPPKRPGGPTVEVRPICGTRGARPCAEGTFCDFPAGSQCGAADQGGRCMPRPDVCTRQYDPVCGCDGKTYGNQCEAHAAGVDASTKGRCPGDVEPGEPEGKVCGGLLGAQCGADEFCNFEGHTNDCGAADGTGVCQRKPEACDLQYMPVCGCDGKTYGNRCEANGRGVSVVHAGECGEEQPADAPASCDHRQVLCRRAEPVCPAGQVASVQGSCWGPCVKLETCTCAQEDQCPHREKYVCHKSAGHCGPYVR